MKSKQDTIQLIGKAYMYEYLKKGKGRKQINLNYLVETKVNEYVLSRRRILVFSQVAETDPQKLQDREA